MYLSAPFIPQNFKKKSYSQSTFMRMHEFCAQNGPFAPIFFFGKHWYYFHLPVGPFHCASFKKIITTDSWWSYDNLLFLGPKWPSCPNENFFRKPETCFFHSWLSTCQKSKSDINLLAKYWQLKNTEISLVQRHFWL